MTETFDLPARLSGALRDRVAAQRFLADFAASWSTTALQPGDGCEEAELAAAEQRLGLAIPAALRDLYLLLGRRGDLTSNHDSLLAPQELHLLDGALVYRAENQGACQWGVLLTALNEEDPGTVVRADLADKSKEHWEPWDSGLLAACLDLVMAEVVQGDGCTGFADSSADDEELTAWCTELPHFSHETRWFVGPGALIRETAGCFLHVLGRSPQVLAATGERLSGFCAD
jgi:hypothetical protein